jgi:hypothetical protein
MQRRVSAGEVQTGFRERIFHEIAVCEADARHRRTAFPCDPDDPLIPIDPGHDAAPRGQLPNKHAVAAPDINSRLAPLRHRVQDHPLIVNIVIPVLTSHRFHL